MLRYMNILSIEKSYLTNNRVKKSVFEVNNSEWKLDYNIEAVVFKKELEGKTITVGYSY